jgi:hypothetical protein
MNREKRTFSLIGKVCLITLVLSGGLAGCAAYDRNAPPSCAGGAKRVLNPGQWDGQPAASLGCE